MTSLLAGKFNSQSLVGDFTASIVVFLVAMPLCMGIAIASGVPPEKGLITGIIGGMVVGLFAGSPLQVSRPAAGLAVLVYEFVTEHGLSALGPLLVLAGLVQLVAGVLKLGGLFRSISPAVVHGMLAGIGALIVVGQFHILFDSKPLSSGLENLAAMPGRLLGLQPYDLRSTEFALLIGLVTIAIMLAWEKLRPQSLRVGAGRVARRRGRHPRCRRPWPGRRARIDVPASIVGAIAAPSPKLPGADDAALDAAHGAGHCLHRER